MVAYDTKPTQSLDKWKVDIPTLDDEEWEDSVSTYIPSVIAAKNRFIQVKFFHRAYYTRQRLARIYPQRDPKLPRCQQEPGSFWHMVLSCPKLQPYWQPVADTLTRVCGTQIPLDPLTLLLSHLEEVQGDRYTMLCLYLSLYYSRREILLKWKSAEPPTREAWCLSVNSVLPHYRLTYQSRQCPAKFDKIWSGWINSNG